MAEQVGALAYHCTVPWGPRVLEDVRAGSLARAACGVLTCSPRPGAVWLKLGPSCLVSPAIVLGMRPAGHWRKTALPSCLLGILRVAMTLQDSGVESRPPGVVHPLVHSIC